tara:strand:- start:1475 stop:1597 length:123 start_codon:yes stop_codon:yes gene_type:complete
MRKPMSISAERLIWKVVNSESQVEKAFSDEEIRRANLNQD